MEILSFKIKGKFAHFRKYYANNSAFSFSIPPRTTLMGIVAAAMGWPKDSYYEQLSSEHIHFGIRVLKPLKKSFQRLNFLSIKSTGDISKSLDSDFRGKRGRIQTPFEVVTGLDLTEGEAGYQIFLTSNESGDEIFTEIKKHFLNEEPVFNLTLGPANFQATMYEEKLFSSDAIREMTSEEFILMHSAIPSKFVEELQFAKDDYDQYNFVEEDLLPADFIENNNREVSNMNRLLFSITNFPLRIRTGSSYWQVEDDVEDLNIQFMDA